MTSQQEWYVGEGYSPVNSVMVCKLYDFQDMKLVSPVFIPIGL